MLEVGTGKAGETNELLEALARGRADIPFFSSFFLNRHLHDGQIEFCTNAVAKVNVLACSNRWGKTTELPVMHFHAGIYKTGAEWRYLDELGAMSYEAFEKTKYETVHTAGEWEQAALTWHEALKLHRESPKLQAFVPGEPRKTLPPHIDFIAGARWMFRTLGVNASGVDGKSLYLISIDEAGWIVDLEEMMANVLRIRVADVYGRVVIVGTFKPGISRGFYKVAVRAAAYTGRAIGFDHRSDEQQDAPADNAGLDSSIKKYLREFGIDLDEYRDAMVSSL